VCAKVQIFLGNLKERTVALLLHPAIAVPYQFTFCFYRSSLLMLRDSSAAVAMTSCGLAFCHSKRAGCQVVLAVKAATTINVLA
jgi:hypothetical protein